jgi:predicted metal-binding membrane protein
LDSTIPHDAPALPVRDRITSLAVLAALAALAWIYLWASPMPMPATSGGLRTLSYFVLTFLMWFVMMIGMMVPSVAPTVLLFDRVARRGSPAGLVNRTLPFVAGYLSAWFLFSVAATVLQIATISAGWIDDMGVSVQPVATAVLLVACGVYQLLPAKRACLSQCQSPAEFLVSRFRPGAGGAWQMGSRHGFYCLGCCWGLMLLLFVGGVMNLLWVAAITAIVLVEKLVARGPWLRILVGGACLAGAAYVFV